MKKEEKNIYQINFKNLIKNHKRNIASTIFFVPTILIFCTRIFQNDENSLETKLIIAVISSILCYLFIYLAVDDALTFSIYTKLAYLILVISFSVNIFVLVTLGIQNEVILFENVIFKPTYNILSGSIIGLFTWLMVKISNEKWLGEGDIFVYTSSALLLGTDKIIPAVYITIISATIFGILLGIKRRTFKKVLIPFVPFIVAGTFVSIIMYPEITTILKNLFPLIF